MTKGERDWLKLQDSFICLSLYLKICTIGCSFLFLSFIDVSWIWDRLYHVRDETYLCFIYVSLETWSLFIYQWFLDLRKMCNECYVWITCVIFIFIRTMHARMKIFDVMPLYLFLCHISCHMHHGFTLSHTHAPHGCNDLGGVSYMF